MKKLTCVLGLALAATCFGLVACDDQTNSSSASSSETASSSTGSSESSETSSSESSSSETSSSEHEHNFVYTTTKEATLFEPGSEKGVCEADDAEDVRAIAAEGTTKDVIKYFTTYAEGITAGEKGVILGISGEDGCGASTYFNKKTEATDADKNLAWDGSKTKIAFDLDLSTMEKGEQVSFVLAFNYDNEGTPVHATEIRVGILKEETGYKFNVLSGINWSDHNAEAAIIEQGHAFTESEVTVSFTAKLSEDKKTVSYGIGVDDDVIEGTAASTNEIVGFRYLWNTYTDAEGIELSNLVRYTYTGSEATLLEDSTEVETLLATGETENLTEKAWGTTAEGVAAAFENDYNPTAAAPVEKGVQLTENEGTGANAYLDSDNNYDWDGSEVTISFDLDLSNLEDGDQLTFFLRVNTEEDKGADDGQGTIGYYDEYFIGIAKKGNQFHFAELTGIDWSNNQTNYNTIVASSKTFTEAEVTASYTFSYNEAEHEMTYVLGVGELEIEGTTAYGAEYGDPIGFRYLWNTTNTAEGGVTLSNLHLVHAAE